jgi:aspartyl-tRNA(Asn)/glutamyl-tRNA(Gln) amidotransferase subunit A
VTGIKPTYGSVSRYGLIAFASSLDQIGPIGCDTADCAALLDVIVGYDRRDSTSIEIKERSYLGNLIKDTEKPDLKGMKIGLPRGYFGEGLDDDVRQAVTGAAKVLAGAGAELEEFDLKTTDYAIPTYYVLATAEASSNLSRFDGVKYGFRAEDYEGLHEMYRMTRSEGFGTEVKRRLMIGGFVLSSGYYDAYYNKALKVKNLIANEFSQAFEKYDMILGPTSPNTAGLLGASKGDPLKLYLSDIFTVSVNIAGLPAISVPCGSDSQGLPVGMQLIGKPFGERKILRAARVYEMVSE